jgi:hypothetical protein
MKKEDYIGKVVLIGLTFVDENDEVIEQYQTHGVITSIDDNDLMKVSRNGCPDFFMPFDDGAMKQANEGTYHERTTGIEVEDPDFLTSWTINDLTESSREYQKLHGYDGFLNQK